MRHRSGVGLSRIVCRDVPGSWATRSLKGATNASRLLRAATLAWVVVWAGCNQIAGIYEGEPRACTTAKDCDLGVSECRTAECKGGECAYVDAPEGMPVANQVIGDCQEVRCDGEGHTRVVPVSNDSDDGKSCTFDECVGTTPRHQIRPWIECYTGDLLTLGQGICKAGKQICNAQGEPEGACVGEILPRTETCFNVFDDDCNGQINEAGAGCTCVMGAIQPCYASTAGSLGVGNCKSGIQECINGLAWGECTLQVLPKPESCATLEDDDCDGEINESGSDCGCGDGILSNFEECDDGNKADGDACSAICTLPSCGNGKKEGGEECDDGNDEDADGCTRSCRTAQCGDGVVQAGMEICDDGNSIGGDGCQEDCTPTPIALGLGHAHSCVIFAHGAVKCWGKNWSGELGLEDSQHRGDQPGEMGSKLPVVKLGTNRTAKAITAGESHTCAILDDDSVKCWGSNDYGQLGLDDTKYRGYGAGSMGDALPTVNLGEKAKTISAGRYHTCAVLESGTLKCWGQGTYGKLGLGGVANWGDKAGDMAKLPAVPLGPGKKALSVMAASDHTCVVQDDAVVRCWGNGSSGRLGQGNEMTYGDDPNEAGGLVVDLGMGKVPFALIKGAGFNACAHLRDGRLACWGESQYCQLATSNSSNIGDQPGEMGDLLPVLNVGAGKMTMEAASGQLHLCALLTGGIVRCWGAYDGGQIGGNVGCAVMGDNRPPVDLGTNNLVAHLAVGGGQSCVILTNGRVKCWGWNDIGQLGLGDLDNRGDQAAEMGDALPAVSLW